MDWASEKLAEDLVKYVDAFNDDPVEVAEREPWNKSYGPSEWKKKDNKVWWGRNDTGEEMAIQFDEVSSLCKSCSWSHHILQPIYASTIPFDFDMRDVTSPRLRLVVIICRIILS
jgi:hypothetical protein